MSKVGRFPSLRNLERSCLSFVPSNDICMLSSPDFFEKLMTRLSIKKLLVIMPCDMIFLLRFGNNPIVQALDYVEG